MKIARIYDDNGQSRFTEIDIEMRAIDSLTSRLASTPFDAEQCRFFSASPQVRPPGPAPRDNSWSCCQERWRSKPATAKSDASVGVICCWQMTHRVADTLRAH